MILGLGGHDLLFLFLGISGFLVGLVVVERIGPRNQQNVESEDIENQQAWINLAIFYATITIVISTVVSQWPPEGQNINPGFTNPFFFLSVFVTAVIVGRVTRLILKLESSL